MIQSERMIVATILLVCLFVSNVGAFSLSTPKRAATRLSQSLADSLFDTISGSLPSFGGKKPEEQTIVPLPPPPFQPTPEGVIQRAKLLLACDLGVQDESLLDPNFIWIGPNLGSKVLGKTDYLAAGKFFDLRSTFPDLDYRAHDFRIDDNDPMTIRVTARTVGTMRGELRLRNEVLPPNGKQMRCPPEAITMTFDERTGRLKKLCSGFTMDRLVGNTDGLCGVMGAATVAGKPPSDWEVYPPAQVVKRFFGRPTQQLEEPASFLAPFPETVMVQLAKGIFSASMAVADPDLLSPSFKYYTPFEGPVDKNTYLEKYASLIFDGLDPELSYLRVDPYDPYRVWVDVKPSGTTSNGVYVDGPPQAFSFTFDDEGFCTRLTALAVMDPSIGNTGGLTGIEGEKYAAGKPSPGIVARPLPQALERVRKRIVSPFTKVGVDEYSLVPGAPVPIRPSGITQSPVDKLKQQTPTPPVKKPTVVTTPKIVPTETKVQQPSPPKKQKPTLTIPKISIPTPSQPDVSEVPAAQKKAQAAAEENKRAKEAAAEEKRVARMEALEAQKQKAAQLAAEREEAARRKEEEIEEARREREAEQARRAEEAEEARQAKAIEIEVAKKRKAAEQAEMEKRRAQEAEATRIARAAAAEAEKTRKAQLAAEAANRKAQAQAMAIESRRKATEAEAAEKAKAEALEAEAKRKAEIANQKAQAAQRKADEIRRAQEAEENRKRQAQLAAEKEAERQRKEKEAAALQREREIAARKAEKEREAAAEAERKKKEKIAAEKQAQKERMEKIAAEKQAQKERKEREAAALKQAREEAAEAKRRRKEQLAMERQAEKERKEREAEIARQERKRKADQAAQKQLERLRRAQEAEATKKAKMAALEAERARQAQIAAEKRKGSAPSPRATISLFGLGGAPKPTAPKPAPKEAAPAPRSTFSLSSFFGGSDSEETTGSSGSAPARPATKSKKAPRGVPVISGWNQNRDGSVTGRITGSSAFGRGEKVTTSPIKGKAVGGTVVQTSSGSKYFLEDTGGISPPASAPRPSISLFGLGGGSEAGESRPSKSVPQPRPSKSIPKPAAPAPSPRPSISLFGLGGSEAGESRPSKTLPKPRPSKSIPKPAAPASSPRPSISLFGLGEGSKADESRPSKSVPKPRPSRPVPKARPSKSIPAQAAPSPSPRATISLFGLGGGSEAGESRRSKSVPKSRPSKSTPKAASPQSSSPRSTISLFGLGGDSTSRSVPVPKTSVKKAPRGVPTLSRWSKNRDGSVTGRITGSDQFEKNEKVTTSPIASGDFSSGSIVKTTSGSRYFLA